LEEQRNRLQNMRNRAEDEGTSNPM
jgi:hypothetical protein